MAPSATDSSPITTSMSELFTPDTSSPNTSGTLGPNIATTSSDTSFTSTESTFTSSTNSITSTTSPTSSTPTPTSLILGTLSHADSTLGAGTTVFVKPTTGTSTRLAVPASSTKSESKPEIAPIAGGIVGGISLLCLVLVLIIWYRRHKSNFPGSKFGGVSAYSVSTSRSRNIDKANPPGNGVWILGSERRNSSNETTRSDTFAEAINNTEPPSGRPGMTASNGIPDTSPDSSLLASRAPAQTEGKILHMKDESTALPSNQIPESGPQFIPEVSSPEDIPSRSLAPAVSLMMQEMESLRARLAQIEQRQPREAHPLPYNVSDIDEDDRRTAPPAYSDDGRS